MSDLQNEVLETTQRQTTLTADDSVHDSASAPFVGQWTQLVSQTNWEKGRIICHWRESLIAAGADATAYSDDAWSRRVGGVSSQHVGRLRRVWQRFADQRDSYPGTFWSHFFAALDWTDAEMWLEGTVQNGWSVSQMRGKRWEALGAPDDLKPRAEDIITEEYSVAAASDFDQGEDPEAVRSGKSLASEVAGADRNRADDSPLDDRASAPDDPGAQPPGATPLADLPELPDELAEAFEQFKVAILNQKVREWPDTSAEEVIQCLDALKELALAT